MISDIVNEHIHSFSLITIVDYSLVSSFGNYFIKHDSTFIFMLTNSIHRSHHFQNIYDKCNFKQGSSNDILFTPIMKVTYCSKNVIELVQS